MTIAGERLKNAALEMRAVVNAPRREVVVESKAEFLAVMATQKELGWTFLTMEDEGLPHGHQKVTFVPAIAFQTMEDTQ